MIVTYIFFMFTFECVLLLLNFGPSTFTLSFPLYSFGSHFVFKAVRIAVIFNFSLSYVNKKKKNDAKNGSPSYRTLHRYHCCVHDDYDDYTNKECKSLLLFTFTTHLSTVVWVQFLFSHLHSLMSFKRFLCFHSQVKGTRLREADGDGKKLKKKSHKSKVCVHASHTEV